MGLKSLKALFGCVWDAFVQRGEAGEQDVALVLLGLPEFCVGAVEPIQYSKHSETLVKPETRKDVSTAVPNPTLQENNKMILAFTKILVLLLIPFWLLC